MIDRTENDALEEAIASVRLSGLTVSDEHIFLLQRVASGELSFSEAKKLVIDSVQRSHEADSDEKW